jgi:formylglycine-generating enzyme required for sulfatase activity
MRHIDRVLFGLTALAAVGCAKGIDPPEPSPVVRIEGGTFMMGGSELAPCGQMSATTMSCQPLLVSEQIVHEVRVDTLCVARNETTIEQYRHCVARGDCTKPQLTNTGIQGQDNFIRRYYNEPDTYGDYPVVGINARQAASYCSSKGGRLLSESEWEYVATSRGTREMIWSDTGDVDLSERVSSNCTGSRGELALGDCAATVQPVGTAQYDTTAEGVQDMAANVSEWVADEFDFLAYCANKDGYAVDRSGSDNKLVFTDGIPSAVLANTDCLAPCDTNYNTCRSVCDRAFTNAGDSDVARREWLTASCRNRFSDRASTPDPTGSPDFACDPNDAAWCTVQPGAPANTCFEYCDCLASDVPPAAFGGVECHTQCIEGWTSCAKADSCAPDAAVACDIERSRPTTWCAPRTGATGKDVITDVPDTLAFRDGQTTHVVRGADVSDAELCDARPTRRQARSSAQSTVGFRCAFDLVGGQCP